MCLHSVVCCYPHVLLTNTDLSCSACVASVVLCGGGLCPWCAEKVGDPSVQQLCCVDTALSGMGGTAHGD